MKPKKEKKPEESHEQVSEAVTWMLVGYVRYAYALVPKYAPKYLVRVQSNRTPRTLTIHLGIRRHRP